MDQSRPAWKRSAEMVAHMDWFPAFGMDADIRETADEGFDYGRWSSPGLLKMPKESRKLAGLIRES